MTRNRAAGAALIVLLAMTGCTDARQDVRPTPGPSSTSTGGPRIAFAPQSLQYIVLDRFGPPVACDPDVYPVGRNDGERLSAEEWWSTLNPGSTLGRAIIDRLGWSYPPAPEQVDRVAAYREHKKLRTVQMTPVDSGRAYQFEFNGPLPGGTGSWDGGPATRFVGFIGLDGRIDQVIERPTDATCPVCLEGETRVRTPDGDRPIRLLRSGDAVLSVDARGRTIEVTIRTTVRRAVIGPLVTFELADGRRLNVSAAHPLPDRRPVGVLAAGDILDGSAIVRRGTGEASGGVTYDILPDGPTGLYWANGILLASTIDAA